MLKQLYNRFWVYVHKRTKAAMLTDSYQRLRSRQLLDIGEYTYGAPTIHSYTGSEEKVSIGKYCSIAPDVHIITGGIHPVDRIALYPFRIQWSLPNAFKDGMPTSNGPVTIGHDVWISTGVTILSGVNVGHGSVIAANALVTKDVPPYSIVGGNPAKLIRYRFSPDEIDSILALEWWNWPKEKVEENIDLLSGTSIESLIRSTEK